MANELIVSDFMPNILPSDVSKHGVGSVTSKTVPFESVFVAKFTSR